MIEWSIIVLGLRLVIVDPPVIVENAMVFVGKLLSMVDQR